METFIDLLIIFAVAAWLLAGAADRLIGKKN